MKKLPLFILILSFFTSFSQSYNLQTGINMLGEEKYDDAIYYLKKELIQNPKETKAFFYLGITYLKKESYGQALTSINQALSLLNQKDSLTAHAWRLKGNIYSRLDDKEKFESSYEKAIELNPTDINILYGSAYGYFKFNNYEKSLLNLKKLLEIDETYLQARGLIMRIYLMQEKYEEVIKSADKIIKLDKSFIDAYESRSIANFKLEKFDLAINDSFNALLLDEKDSRIQENFVYYSKKNYTLAIAKISNLIREFPQKDLWLYIRSLLYREKKDYKNALVDYAKIFEIIPDSYQSFFYRQRATMFSEMGLHEKSILDYTETIKLDSSSAYDFGKRGDEYRLSGNYISAISDFTKAIDIEPEEPWFYYRRGWINDEFLKKPKDGLADYTSAIEIDPNYAYTYLNRGRLYAQQFKDTLLANADFRKLILLDTIISSGGNCRHYGYMELGQYEKAKEWNNKILKQFPEEGNYYDAACLYSQMKIPTKAIAYLDSAFQKGYRDFTHLNKDDDLFNIRNLPEFKTLLTKWKATFEMNKPQISKNEKSLNKITGTYIIPYKPKGEGTYEIESKINGLPLNMLFDTGASDISISQTEVDFMLKNGHLNENDYLGYENYNLANGENEVFQTIMLRKVEIGGLTLKNIRAAVTSNRNAGLLFGQSVMSKYGKIIIDNKKKQIILKGD